MPKKPIEESFNMTVRIPASMLQRIKHLTACVQEDMPFTKHTDSDTVRMALHFGLDNFMLKIEK